MDLHDQYTYMDKTGQWRFTPPTHVVVALAEAISQFEAEGGQPARLARYTDNYRTLLDGMGRHGLHAFPGPFGSGAHHRDLSTRRVMRATSSRRSTTRPRPMASSSTPAS
jgi:aspartate aminotransferase-like enzyme